MLLAQLATVAAVVLVFFFGAMGGSGLQVERGRRSVNVGVGVVEFEVNARWRMLARSADLVKLRLEEGTMHASIGAFVKPGLFQVETPATTCVDLGCRYTLTVDVQGRSRVSVQTGRVAFSDRGREVYVPRGASCRATRERGAGTPVYDDAGAALKSAVVVFDAATGSRVEPARAVLAACERSDDALTAWHVAMDGEGAVAEEGYGAMVRLVGEPEGVTKEATMRREAGAIEGWKRKMGWW